MLLGIDYGTTRTVVAAVDRGNYPVVSFQGEQGDPQEWYPSLIAFSREGAGRAYGFDARARQHEAGWTRSLRYFNHRTGKKYVGPVPADKKGRSGAHGREQASPEHDYAKLESAKIFKAKLDEVRADPDYAALAARHRERYERRPRAPE